MLDYMEIRKKNKPLHKVSDIIKATQELLAQDRWTKHASARDMHGNPCPVSSEEACRFCASGAFRYIQEIHYTSLPAYNMAVELTVRAVMKYSSVWNTLVSFNDARETTHEMIQDVFRIAYADAAMDELTQTQTQRQS